MSSTYPPIAIVAMSSIFPGSESVQGFFRDLIEGKDLFSEIPPTHFLIDDYYDPDPKAVDHIYTRRGAFMPPVDFSPVDFGMPPNQLEATDTAQLLALIAAKKALDEATQSVTIDKNRISVILGVAAATELLGTMVGRMQIPVLKNLLKESGLDPEHSEDILQRYRSAYVDWQESTFPGLLPNCVAGRVANRLDLGGTNCVLDAACASSLAALSMALNELYLNQADLVITGGVDALNDILMYMCFSRTGAMSFTDDCRPFSDQADGTMMGEGIGIFGLRRLEDAERDGNKIYAVIKGLGSSSDGLAKSIYAPRSEGQAKAMKKAYQYAGYSPATVELIEAHGTGTVAGDKAEFDSMSMVFDNGDREERQWCGLGSIKSQIGHMKAAAGSASLMKVALALYHKVLLPTIKVEQPNPVLNIENSPFYLNTQTRPWFANPNYPRRGALSSFGFGGTNFHVTLEEYTPPQPQPQQNLRYMPVELFVLSAANRESLIQSCEKLIAELDTPNLLSYLAHQTQANADSSLPSRLSLSAKDEGEMQKKLQQAIAQLKTNSANQWQTPTGITFSETPLEGKTAFVFSGQGSQYVNMGAELALSFGECREVWERANKIAHDEKHSLTDITFPKPVFSEEKRSEQFDTLKQTSWAQPAIGAMSLSLLQLLDAMGIEPDCAAGHSYGEVTALFKAGLVDEENFFKISHKRGELMDYYSRKIPGAMLAVATDSATLTPVLVELKLGLVIANQNSPQQTVISGSETEILQAEKELTQKGFKAKRLPTKTAFHSPLVAEASPPFTEWLQNIPFQEARIPVWSNTTAQIYPTDKQAIRSMLGEQLEKPVKFQELIENMYQAGARTFIEVGPASVLSGLVSDILASQPHQVITLNKKSKDARATLLEALGQIFVRGIKFSFEPLWSGFVLPQDPRQQPKSKFSVQLTGGNYNKRYPRQGEAKAPPPFQSKKPTQVLPVQSVQPSAPVAVPPPVQASPPVAAPVVQQAASPVFSQPVQAPILPENNSEWLNAYQVIQQETSRVFMEHQRLMAQSQKDYLKLASQSMQALLTGQWSDSIPVESEPLAYAPPVVNVAPTPVIAPPPVRQPVAAPPVTPPTLVSPSPLPAPVVTSVSAPPPAPAVMAAPSVDLVKTMIAIVAEKTGYPVEMIEPTMNLEADLGIDSIKRVEILSTMQEEVPSLQDADTTQVSTLETIQEIVDYMQQFNSGSAVIPSTLAPAVIIASVPSSAPSVDLVKTMIAIVAEKTGYPVEMIEPTMNLEADLGIDSIKRVEILSTMQEEVPSLQDADTTQVSTLETIQEIVDYMQQFNGDPIPAASQPVAVAVAEPPSTAAPSVDLVKTMIAIVAEKTGYPVEMIEPTMNLEADLGIDSIKRVEILSTMQEEVPSLQDADTTQVSTLETIQEIVDYMQQFNGGSSSVVSVPQSVAKTSEPVALARLAVRLVEAPESGLASLRLSGEGLEIIQDEAGIALALKNRLAKEGLVASVVERPTPQSRQVIYLEGLKAIQTPEEAIQVNYRAFELAKQLAPHFSEHGHLFVTVQDTGGDFGRSGEPERAWLAGLGGLAKTMGREWPHLRVKAIDLKRGQLKAEEIANIIVEELLKGGPEEEVALQVNGKRLTPVAIEELVANSNSRINSQSVLLVSGGARGVTAASIIALAQETKARFVLLGTSRLADEPLEVRNLKTEADIKKTLFQLSQQQGQKLSPQELQKQVARILKTREIRANLDAIERAGSQVKYFPVNIVDLASVAQCLEQVRQEWGSITGIVHGAGVIADALLTTKTSAQFASVFETKVQGLQNLLQATEQDPLNLLCLFSSVSARTGNPGQSDYAMANEVLNKVAWSEQQRRPEALVCSLNWGPWEGGMVNPALKHVFESRGVALIPLEPGAKQFVKEVQSVQHGDLEIVLGGAVLNSTPQHLAVNGAKEFDFLVERAAYPQLDAHRVKGKVVLPVAMALAWAVKGAQSFFVTACFKGCEQLQVHKGVTLFQTDSERDIIQFTFDVVDQESVAFQLYHQNSLCYSGRLQFTSDDQLEQSTLSLTSLDSLPVFAAPYETPALFHDEAFQVLESLHQDQSTAVGMIKPALLKDWTSSSYVVDPAAFDGLMQLAVMLHFNRHQKPALPLKIRNYRQYSSPGSHLLQGIAKVINSSNLKTTADIQLIDSVTSNLVMECQGVEVYTYTLDS